MKKFIFLIVFAIAANLFFGNTVAGQVSQRGFSSDNSISGGVLTMDVPAGVVAGDVMIVNIVQTRSSDGGVLQDAINAGWIEIAESDLGSANSTRSRGTVLYRIATGSEPASYDFDLDDNSNSAAGGLTAFFNVANTGVDHNGNPGGPFDVDPGSFSTGSGTAVSCTGINGVSNGAGIVMVLLNRNNRTLSGWDATNPSSLTEVFDVSNSASDGTTAGAAFNTAAAGNTGSGVATISGSELWAAMLIALKPAPPSATLTPALSSVLAAGTGATLTATAVGLFAGSGNTYSYTWTATGGVIGGGAVATNQGTTNNKTITYALPGAYSVSVAVARSTTNVVSNSVTVHAYTVNAGTNQSIVVDNANLSGTASGGAGINSYAWTQQSGPAGAAFGSPSSAATTVTNLSTGVYVFRLTVNGLANIFDDVQVTVTLPPNQSIGCNGAFFVSHGSAGTSTSTTSLEKLSFSGGLISANAFSTDPTTIGFNGIGLNPKDGFMYGIRYPASGQFARLVKIGNGTPGNIVDQGALSGGGLAADNFIYAGCFDSNGDFYITTDNDLLLKITGINYPAVSLTTALVGNVSASDGYFVDMAIDPTDGQLYGETSNQVLYKINKTNGALTTVGTTAGSQIYALFFDEVGGLFGYRADGTFQKIDKGTAGLTSVGTAPTYTFADGCSCSFGRVFHDLDFTQNPGNQVCPTQGNPQPSFPLTVSVTNQTSAAQTGLTYTLSIVDPLKRFRFTESAATIRANVIAAGLALNDAGTVVTLSTQAPATGTNYNKVVITGFRTGAPASTLNFVLQVQLYTLGGTYTAVPLQSSITGLLPIYGGSDQSNDPTSPAPDDPTTITFCNDITLPVQLISFTGVYRDNSSELFWVAENQFNFAHYELERSSNGVDFSLLTVKAAQVGPSRQSYQYTDDLSLAAGNVFYYRLKMVDIDGSFKYSNVIMIRKGGKIAEGISISPNPIVKSDAVTARVTVAAAGTVNLSVVDMAGRVVLRQQNPVSEGVNSIAITNLDRLQPGVYLLKMNNGEKVESTKFTVIR